MSFVCPQCGSVHSELLALGSIAPDYWLSLSEGQRARGKIDSDLCASGDGHFFIRCVLQLPLIGGPVGVFEFGPWSSLSEDNFWRYEGAYDDPAQGGLGAMFGWLSNELRGFPESLHLAGEVIPRTEKLRPTIILKPSDHPLYKAQQEGILFERALELVHDYL